MKKMRIPKGLLFPAVLLIAVLWTAGCSQTQKLNAVPAPGKGMIPAITFGDKFYDVAAPDERQIWAVGYFGAITHSPDGGNSWSRQQAGTTQSFTGVSFVNVKEGWIVGDQGTILHTQDGGGHWEKQKSPVPDQKLLKVQFFNGQEGFCVGTFGTVLHTADGGRTWEKLPFNEDVILNDLVFLNSREGWISGEFETILHTHS